jgi:hypothetical protein
MVGVLSKIICTAVVASNVDARKQLDREGMMP